MSCCRCSRVVWQRQTSKCCDDRRIRKRFYVWAIFWYLGNLACSILVFLSFLRRNIKPESPSTSVEVGGNVPVLLNLSGFDPFWYDQVQITGLTAGSNTTLLRGLCEDLSTVRVPLDPKNIFFKNSSKSSLPFNYHGGDIPVYSAGGNDSFISFNISAEATGDNQNDSHQSCGAQLINFDNLTSYMEFINNQATYPSFSLPSCLPVGPPGLPCTTSVLLFLHEPGFYRQAVLVNTTLSINSSVIGSLSSYNTSSLQPVFCNTVNCTIRISTLPSTQNPRVCILVLTSEYTAVEFRALGSFDILSSFQIRLLYGATLVWNAHMFAILICICRSERARKNHGQTVSYKPEFRFSLSVLCGTLMCLSAKALELGIQIV